MQASKRSVNYRTQHQADFRYRVEKLINYGLVHISSSQPAEISASSMLSIYPFIFGILP